MNKEEIFKYLQENLEIRVCEKTYCDGDTSYKIQLYLENEFISETDSITVNQ